MDLVKLRLILTILELVLRELEAGKIDPVAVVKGLLGKLQQIYEDEILAVATRPFADQAENGSPKTLNFHVREEIEVRDRFGE